MTFAVICMEMMSTILFVCCDHRTLCGRKLAQSARNGLKGLRKQQGVTSSFVFFMRGSTGGRMRIQTEPC